jgi:Zn-dependent metalloprotease
MGAVLTLIGGAKGIVMIALILAALGWVAVQKRAVTRAEAARDAAIVQRDQAGIERDKAIAVAKTNAETITQLEQEKADINTALNNLAAAQTANRAATTVRETIIQRQATAPTSTAVVAPVIASIITAVQEDRVRRRATP